MAINAISQVYPHKNLLLNMSARPGAKNKVENRNCTDLFLKQKRISAPDELEVLIVDFDELIDSLQDIMKQRSNEQFGFGKTEKKAEEIEKDTILGNIAKAFYENLIDEYENPSQAITVNAIRFVKLYQLITNLEQIEKERDSCLGLKCSLSKEDQQLAARAKNLVEMLIKKSNTRSLQACKKFLKIYQIIGDLEEMARSKFNNDNLGFRHGKIKRKDIEIGNKALQYAKALKLKDDKNTLTTAMFFLELNSIELEKIKEKVLVSVEPNYLDKDV